MAAMPPQERRVASGLEGQPIRRRFSAITMSSGCSSSGNSGSASRMVRRIMASRPHSPCFDMDDWGAPGCRFDARTHNLGGAEAWRPHPPAIPPTMALLLPDGPEPDRKVALPHLDEVESPAIGGLVWQLQQMRIIHCVIRGRRHTVGQPGPRAKMVCGAQPPWGTATTRHEASTTCSEARSRWRKSN